MYSKDNIFKRMAEERGITEEEMREDVYRTGGQFCRSYGSAGWADVYL